MTTRDTRESESGFVIESDILPIINEDGSERQSQNGKEFLIYVQCNLDSVTLNLENNLQFSGCFAKYVHFFNPFDT